jgi:Fe-S cluster assembly ATP-binding protein
LIITHHERLLEFNKPHRTHVMLAGRIVETGDAALAHELHAHGYGGVRERHPEAAELEKVAMEKTVAKTAGDKPAQPEAELAAS